MLERLWRARRPDAVYVATEGVLGLSAVRCARRLGLPVFSGFHTNFDAYAGYYRAPWARASLLRYLRWFHNTTDGTLVATAALRDRLREAGFDALSVLGRGVDTARFSPAHRDEALRRAWGVEPEGVVALAVGRVAAEKNLALTLRTYRVLQSRGLASALVIVGDGPLRRQLQTENPDVVFTGTLTGQALAATYASGDLFLFPSETETFGNVTLEAMASGLVVVAFDYAAAHEHIRHLQNGVLVPVGGSTQFVRAACAVVRQPLRRRMIRHLAREQAAQADWRVVVDRFVDTLAGGRPSASGAGLGVGVLAPVDAARTR